MGHAGKERVGMLRENQGSETGGWEKEIDVADSGCRHDGDGGWRLM